MQPNNTSNNTMIQVNLVLASVCLVAMLGIETKCLWRIYCCWRANQIWFALRPAQSCTTMSPTCEQKLLSLLLQIRTKFVEYQVGCYHASMPECWGTSSSICPRHAR